MKRKPKTIEIPDKVSFETFRDPRGSYNVGSMTEREPTCFNGNVSVRKFKVTIELIDEPVEVIQERIKHLWGKCDNYHHREPLKSVAAKYGIELKH